MSNSIWHKSDEKPIYHKWVCVKYPNAPVKPVCKFIEENTYISYACEYAYLDELLAQMDKAEGLQKAVDLALAELHEIDRVCDDYKYTDNLYVGLDGHDTCNIALDVKKTITQITTLIKGGSNE